MAFQKYYRAAAILFLAVAMVGSTTISVEAQQSLRWKFRPGQKLRVQFVQKTSTETTQGDESLAMTIEMLMEMDWLVESVDDDGTTHMAQSFRRVRMKMQTPDVKAIEYDSDSKQKPTSDARKIAESIGPLLEAKFYVTMFNRGQINEVKLSEETEAAFKKEAGNKTSNLKTLFSKEKINEILRQSAFTLPEKQLAVGDTWMESKPVRSPLGILTPKNTYTYAGKQQRDGRPLERITILTAIQLKNPANSDGPKIKLIEQKQTGVLYFDAEAGRLVESELSQHLVLEKKYREFTFRTTADTTSQMTISEIGNESKR